VTISCNHRHLEVRCTSDLLKTRSSLLNTNQKPQPTEIATLMMRVQPHSLVSRERIIVQTMGTLAICTYLAMPTTAFGADAANGKRLAERWCTSCHIVSSTQREGSTQAPPFSEIAKKQQVNASGLALFLLAPHPKMPDMNLTRLEAADLSAYIVNLK
jgi:mono/diheme cytochrome c family protein